MFSVNRQINLLLVIAASFLAVYGCEPPRPYRMPAPSSNPVPPRPQPSAPLPPPPASETVGKALPQDAKIREQDLKDKTPPPSQLGKETKDSGRQASLGENRAPSDSAPPALPPPLPDDSSLLAKITPGVTPQRAASLRLTEEGKKLLEAGEPAKALARLERTIVIDSSNPYGYFYLAKAQYRLGRYQQSLNFLDISESRLGNEPFWLAEIFALRGENYRALGQAQKAEASYLQAVRLNSGNRTAADALSRLQADIQPASR